MALDKQDEETLVAHQKTYSEFLGWLKWGILIIAFLLIVLALTLVR